MGSIDTSVEYIVFCHRQLVFFFLSFILCGITGNWKKLDLSCLIQAMSYEYFDLPRIRKHENGWKCKEIFIILSYLIGAKLEIASCW